ncbi:Lethal(3)malignant brain tumor-like protein 3 [Chelonia mydas]|uniref:Lethal(3)malignant brain tumor-like protein 3 n=1 Tax=Chelonia mydas TaxID=8469 RepID=M7BA92_CHEMY|nr:Lethal(3)malignant brain tumor-like protein 3 [Chelonia mydas]
MALTLSQLDELVLLLAASGVQQGPRCQDMQEACLCTLAALLTGSYQSCPYSDVNLNKERILPDRLSGEMPLASPSVPKNRRTENLKALLSRKTCAFLYIAISREEMALSELSLQMIELTKIDADFIMYDLARVQTIKMLIII